MIHLGDIAGISGYDVSPVDVVIGGSPCQDLSVAGKRAGLSGERSGLFMEQIRLIKELRNADIQRGRTGVFIRPRFMVWENVPGAFSSNKGNDFRAVLEETIRIAEPDAPDVPLPAKGKWPLADCWMGDGWSVAYRVLDAQFWGVPQRRRRIALVADFGGRAAPEILFVRESVCGDTAESGAAEEETAAGTGNGVDCPDGCLTPWDVQSRRIYQENGVWPALYGGEGGGHGYVSTGFGDGVYPAIARSLTARYDGSPCIDRGPNIVWCLQGNAVAYSFDSLASNSMKSNNPHSGCRIVDVSKTLDASGPDPSKNQGGIAILQKVFDARGNGDGKTVCTLTGDHQSCVTDYTAIVMATGQTGAEITPDIAPTLNCNHEQPIVAGIDCRNGKENGDLCGTLQAKPSGGFSLNCTHPVRIGRIVRRLTPMECERLQGYPDGWTDIGAWTDSKGKLRKESSDAARYKALGNSIALPPWVWVLKRLCGCYERPATMASLFDGIGGFPLLWERLNGPGSCLWASEIEEFPIAVTRRRFMKQEEHQ